MPDLRVGPGEGGTFLSPSASQEVPGMVANLLLSGQVTEGTSGAECATSWPFLGPALFLVPVAF